jgi:hypothetical protein
MLPRGSLVLLGTMAASAYLWLERYRPTSYGHNPWTAEGIRNVVILHPYFERAREMVGAESFNSVYRSVRVNDLIPGSTKARVDKKGRVVGGSDHLHGRAIDITPKGTLERESRRLYDAALSGELGPVREVLWEPGWIHIGWRPHDATNRTVEYQRKPKGGKWVTLDEGTRAA